MHPTFKQPLPHLPEPLSRLLRQWGVAPVSPASPAERLGSLLGWADAIGLSQTMATAPGGAVSETERLEAIRWAQAGLETLQASLTSGFDTPELPAESLQSPDGPLLPEMLAPYLQHFSQQQRAIVSRIASFRDRLRSRLVRASDELARVAELDLYIERALSDTERRSLAGLAELLEKRALKHHSADPLRWRSPLTSDMQRLLRADLDQRLQPVLGLIEALSATKSP